MKIINKELMYVLMFTSLNFSMEQVKQRSWIETKDKKILFMNEYDTNQSLLINMIRKSNLLYSGSSEWYSMVIDVKKKDLKFFIKIVHQPALYHTFKLKKCYKALLIAEKLKAPLLYAELLHERLPAKITKRINKKYMSLYNVIPTLQHALKSRAELNFVNQLEDCITIKQQDNLTNTFDSYIENIPRQINTFIKPIILPQTILFTLFYYEKYCIKVQPHTAGYPSFKKLTEDQLHLLRTLCKSSL